MRRRSSASKSLRTPAGNPMPHTIARNAGMRQYIIRNSISSLSPTRFWGRIELRSCQPKTIFMFTAIIIVAAGCALVYLLRRNFRRAWYVLRTGGEHPDWEQLGAEYFLGKNKEENLSRLTTKALLINNTPISS